MPYDYKKEYKELYQPKTTPSLIEVPSIQYIAVRGTGNPNEEDGDYQVAVSLLYAISYTIKMSYKSEYKIEGFMEYVVPPLEGFWWQEGIEGVDYNKKETFHWISVIRIPDFVSQNDLEWAKKEVLKKKKLDCSKVEILTIEEGLCVQVMHIGPYNDEPKTVARMDQFIAQMGYENDISKSRLHHEIYLCDPRKVAPDKCKTVLRHPVKKVQ